MKKQTLLLVAVGGVLVWYFFIRKSAIRTVSTRTDIFGGVQKTPLTTLVDYIQEPQQHLLVDTGGLPHKLFSSFS